MRLHSSINLGYTSNNQGTYLNMYMYIYAVVGCHLGYATGGTFYR